MFIFITGCLALIVLEKKGKHDQFLHLAAFLMPFLGLNFALGTNFWWAMYIFPVSILAIKQTKRNGYNFKRIHAFKYLVMFFTYAFILTIVRAGLDYMSSEPRYLSVVALGWGPAQSTYRYPVQLISFVFTWGAIFTTLLMTKTEKNVNSIVNGFVNGCLVNVFISVYLLAAFSFGVPYPGIFLPEVTTLSGYATKMALPGTGLPFTIYRLSGLGGEPKHLASSLVLAVMLIQSLQFFKSPGIYIKRANLKIVILIVAAILTFSTGGLIAIGISTAVLYGFNMYQQRQRIGAFIIVGLIFVIFGGFFGAIPTIGSLFEARVSDRTEGGLDGLAKNEPKDAAFIEYIITNPLNAIIGHGTGGIDFWLIKSKYLERWTSQRTSTVTPAYLPTRLLGDVGVIGIIILIILIRKWSILFDEEDKKAYKTFLLIGALSLCMSSQLALPAYLYIVGAMVAIVSRKRFERMNPKTLNNIQVAYNVPKNNCSNTIF